MAASARNLVSLKELKAEFGAQLLPIQLDVTNRQVAIGAVHQANQHFSRIDVLINNAGYGLFGSVEETSEQQARDLMETNFFGLLWLSKSSWLFYENGRDFILTRLIALAKPV